MLHIVRVLRTSWRVLLQGPGSLGALMQCLFGLPISRSICGGVTEDTGEVYQEALGNWAGVMQGDAQQTGMFQYGNEKAGGGMTACRTGKAGDGVDVQQ